MIGSTNKARENYIKKQNLIFTNSKIIIFSKKLN